MSETITPTQERLIRMEAKLDAFLFRTDQHEGRLGAHDLRLSGLERAFAKTIGIAVGVSAVISLAGTYLTKLASII